LRNQKKKDDKPIHDLAIFYKVSVLVLLEDKLEERMVFLLLS
jgi:hypothetical protein